MGKLISKILPMILCIILISLLSFCSKDDSSVGPSKPNDWSLVPAGLLFDVDSNRIDVGLYAVPDLVDIDDDNDLDLFIGEWFGQIWFYRNTGSAKQPEWTFVTDNYFSIDVGRSAAPTFTDIDGDGDYDLLIGKSYTVGHVGPVGNIVFYRNTGTSDSANFVLVTDSLLSYHTMGIGKPEFIDIDSDHDLDLIASYSETDLSGGHEGILLFRNVGDRVNPVFEYVTNEYQGWTGRIWPAFADVDRDLDLDALIGGNRDIQLCIQIGSDLSPNWSCTQILTIFNDSLTFNMTPHLADVNRDGIFDLLIGNGSDRQTVKLGGTIYLFYGTWDQD